MTLPIRNINNLSARQLSYAGAVTDAGQFAEFLDMIVREQYKRKHNGFVSPDVSYGVKLTNRANTESKSGGRVFYFRIVNDGRGPIRGKRGGKLRFAYLTGSPTVAGEVGPAKGHHMAERGLARAQAELPGLLAQRFREWANNKIVVPGREDILVGNAEAFGETYIKQTGVGFADKDLNRIQKRLFGRTNKHKFRKITVAHLAARHDRASMLDEISEFDELAHDRAEGKYDSQRKKFEALLNSEAPIDWGEASVKIISEQELPEFDDAMAHGFVDALKDRAEQQIVSQLKLGGELARAQVLGDVEEARSYIEAQRDRIVAELSQTHAASYAAASIGIGANIFSNRQIHPRLVAQTTGLGRQSINTGNRAEIELANYGNGLLKLARSEIIKRLIAMPNWASMAAMFSPLVFRQAEHFRAVTPVRSQFKLAYADGQARVLEPPGGALRAGYVFVTNKAFEEILNEK